MVFDRLINSIQSTHEELQLSAIKAVNQSLTLRNWLIGLYIVEFEQNGEDRARYGDRLMPELAKSLKIKGLSETNLKLCRLFYTAYPHLDSDIKSVIKISGINVLEIRQTASDEFNMVQKTQVDQENQHLILSTEILSKLSFSHLVQLLPIQNLEKRTFYELECIKQAWSVGELKRQINTLCYERSEIIKKPNQLSEVVKQKAEPMDPKDIIKSPFTFEFLGLKAKDVVYENDLEKSLLEHLEGFLLEMGHGFCFEAKQKRILIGGEYFFIDLVFYHRILKCHILVELKVDEAKHEHIGQLKTYVNYYKKEMMQKDDNPPVGLLLVTNQNKALVEYAIADSDQQLFVSKYLLELPSEEELIAEIERENNVLREQGIVYGREELI